MKLDIREVSFLKQATESIQIAGKDAPFVSMVLSKLNSEVEKLLEKENTKPKGE